MSSREPGTQLALFVALLALNTLYSAGRKKRQRPCCWWRLRRLRREMRCEDDVGAVMGLKLRTRSMRNPLTTGPGDADEDGEALLVSLSLSRVGSCWCCCCCCCCC
uniref:Putative secreted peptide n=1 Tax=Anopheles braziliensis TaxID=58242 RepID=A0A2M3ZT59_9DIPT